MAKYRTKGSTLKFGASNPPTATVGQLGDSTFDPGERVATIDDTTHDNTSGVLDKLDPGFQQPPVLDGEIVLDPNDAVHEALRAAFFSGATNYAQLILTNATNSKFTWACRVKRFGIPVPVNGKLVAQISLEGLGGATTYVQ